MLRASSVRSACLAGPRVFRRSFFRGLSGVCPQFITRISAGRDVSNHWRDRTAVLTQCDRLSSSVAATRQSEQPAQEQVAAMDAAIPSPAVTTEPLGGLGAGGTLPPLGSGGVLGWLNWVAHLAIGGVMSTGLNLKLLFQFITNPFRTLYRQDRSLIQFPDPLPDLTHEWIETAPGIKIHAVRTSKCSGKPLMLMVHGFPEAWFSWRKQMAAFRDWYEVVAIDMRGYNESRKPPGRHSYRLDAVVADVASVAQHLLNETGQEKLVLVGHDWGANVCWGVAATSPHLLSRLAILCVPHPECFKPNMDWNQFLRSWYIFAFQLPFIPEFAMRINDYAQIEMALSLPPMGCTTPGAITKEYIERYKQAFARPGAATAAINYYRCIIDIQTRYPAPALQRAMRRRIQVPTLVIWAENDTALGPQLLRGTERYVDNLRVEMVKGSSHWVQQDKPEEVNRLLTEFLGAARS